MWDAGTRVPQLLQEVREHIKAVTCLYVSSSGDKMYSGSMDKTIRVKCTVALFFFYFLLFQFFVFFLVEGGKRKVI